MAGCRSSWPGNSWATSPDGPLFEWFWPGGGLTLRHRVCLAFGLLGTGPDLKWDSVKLEVLLASEATTSHPMYFGSFRCISPCFPCSFDVSHVKHDES